MKCFDNLALKHLSIPFLNYSVIVNRLCEIPIHYSNLTNPVSLKLINLICMNILHRALGWIVATVQTTVTIIQARANLSVCLRLQQLRNFLARRDLHFFAFHRISRQFGWENVTNLSGFHCFVEIVEVWDGRSFVGWCHDGRWLDWWQFGVDRGDLRLALR